MSGVMAQFACGLLKRLSAGGSSIKRGREVGRGEIAICIHCRAVRFTDCATIANKIPLIIPINTESSASGTVSAGLANTD